MIQTIFTHDCPRCESEQIARNGTDYKGVHEGLGRLLRHSGLETRRDLLWWGLQRPKHLPDAIGHLTRQPIDRVEVSNPHALSGDHRPVLEDVLGEQLATVQIERGACCDDPLVDVVSGERLVDAPVEVVEITLDVGPEHDGIVGAFDEIRHGRPEATQGVAQALASCCLGGPTCRQWRQDATLS